MHLATILVMMRWVRESSINRRHMMAKHGDIFSILKQDHDLHRDILDKLEDTHEE